MFFEMCAEEAELYGMVKSEVSKAPMAPEADVHWPTVCIQPR